MNRSRLRNSTLLFIVTIVLVSTGCRSSPSRAARMESSAAPDFSVTDLSGQTVALSNYKGKVVLLNFWATWCGPCEREIPAFIQFQKQYGPQGLQIVGISMDDSAKPVREFYQRFQMNYPVAMGDAKLGQLYGGVYGLPVNFVIARDGHLAAKYVGATDLATLEQQIRAQISPVHS